MCKILIIDDELDYAYTIRDYLIMDPEYLVAVETDPEKALYAAHECKPDLILLDIIMPKKNGFEVLEDLKGDQMTLSIPIIMLSVVEAERCQINAAQGYAEDYLIKPVSLRELKKKIEAVRKRHVKLG